MQTVVSEPWTIDASAFPASAPPAERLRFLLRYAVLAPSSHNTQPWRFRIAGDAVELRADGSRRLDVADPDGRERVLSCAAALFLLRLATRRFGWMDDVELLPDPADPDHLATVRLGDHASPSREIRMLFDAIPRRRTHRLPFDERAVAASISAALAEAAQDEGAVLHLVGGAEQVAVADLVARGERAQFADPRFRAELAGWIRPGREVHGDGIPAPALGIPRIFGAVVPTLIAGADSGRLLSGRERRAAEDAPLLAVLATETDSPREWLAAGQALARLLLVATAEGLAASFLNQPVQVPEIRQRLRRVLETGDAPQAVLRIGYAAPVPPTPRRPLSEVVDG
jgi:nitroreductase